MGSVSFLVETRGQNSGINIARRAYTQLLAAKSLLETFYDKADETKALVAKARANAVEMGKTFDPNRMIYLNQTASGNANNFRTTGIENPGSRYTKYKGAATTIDLLGNEMTHTTGATTNLMKALALNDTSNRNRPRPTAYVVPKGIERTETGDGVTTVTVSNDYAINYDHLINSMKWNHIEFYEMKPGTTIAGLRQYYRSDTGNTTNSTSAIAGLRDAAMVTFEKGAYVIPVDQVAGAVVVALFEPDISNSGNYNAAVTQSLSNAEGLALIFHDVTTRNYPYYRLEADNPRDVLAEPIDISVIDGVTPPEYGIIPVKTIKETDQFTGTVTWNPSITTTFEISTDYTATITLEPKNGFTLRGIPENFFEVDGAIASNAAGSGVITAVFPATEEAFDFVQEGCNAGLGYIGAAVLLLGIATTFKFKNRKK